MSDAVLSQFKQEEKAEAVVTSSDENVDRPKIIEKFTKVPVAALTFCAILLFESFKD